MRAISFPPLILSFLFSYSVLFLSLFLSFPLTFPPCLFSSGSYFILPFPSLFSMRSTLSLLLSLSLSLTSFYLSPTPRLLSLSLSFIYPALFFIPSFSLSVNSSFLFSFSQSLTPFYPSLCLYPLHPEHFPLSSLESTSSVYACRPLLPSPSL